MIISKTQLAAELNVSKPRISQYIEIGMPVRADGRVDLLAACYWVIGNISDDPPSPALAAARKLVKAGKLVPAPRSARYPGRVVPRAAH